MSNLLIPLSLIEKCGKSSSRDHALKCSSRFSRAVSAASSGGAGSCTAMPGGTASPGSTPRRCRLPRAGAAGFEPPLAGAGGGAAWFSSRATWSSSSAIRAAAVFAARLASLLLVRSVALARSSCSTCARNSSLLSLGAAGEAAPACSGAAVVLVTLAEVFAVAAAGQPGLRVGVAGFLASVAFTGRAMSLGSFHRSRKVACQPALRVISFLQASAREGILHLFRRAEAQLARRRDLNRLARARIAALACRAVLHLELPEAGETDLFALLRGLDDAGEHRVDGLPGRALLDARLARHVIDQVSYFHSGLLE